MSLGKAGRPGQEIKHSEIDTGVASEGKQELVFRAASLSWGQKAGGQEGTD